MTVLGSSYRLGATSYVWPAGLVPNASKLGPLVDDVELVLFDTDQHSNLPGTSAVRSLACLAERHDLTYTVHLPLDLTLADPNSVELAQKVMDCTRPLDPYAYVLHLDGRSVAAEPDPATLRRWRDDASLALDQVGRMAGDKGRLCIENLENYCPECYLPLLARSPVSLCIDVGHLWLVGRDPMPLLEANLDRTRVIHIHGIQLDGGAERDHHSLACQDARAVADVLHLLSRRSYAGVLTMEVFDLADFMSSRELVERIVNGKR